MLVLDMILFDELFDYVLIPEDCELLLQRWLFLLSNIQFNNGCMNILHYLILIEGECDMNAGAIYEFIEGFFIKPHYEMFQKDIIQVRSLRLSFPIAV